MSQRHRERWPLKRFRRWLWTIPPYARLRTEWRKITGKYNPTREDDDA